MKNFYVSLFLLFSIANVSAQDKQTLELQNRFWNSGNEKQNTVKVPEKWKDESAVILYLEENYTYSNTGKKMFYPSFFHERIVLQDKAAVEDYSEFAFDKNESYGGLIIPGYQTKTIVGIKIIKPSGAETILDIDEEKVVQDQQFKIAVPGLEIGDVLDIFVYCDDFSKTEYGKNTFEPVESVLGEKYPIVYRKLVVEIEKNFFLNMQTYNGAPKIEEIDTDKNRTRKYILEINDIEKWDFPRWAYPLVETPAVKFQVVFAQKNHSSDAFLAKNDAIRKTEVSQEEFFDYYSNNGPYPKAYLDEIIDFLKEKGDLSKRELMLEAFYYTRHKNFNRLLEIVLSNKNGILGYDEPCEGYFLLNENRFVQYMAGVALKNEVDYDIILATADYNGSIDSLLIQQNLVLGLRMNFAEPLYFFELSPHVQAGSMPPHLEGTKAYVYEVEPDGRSITEELKFETLPVSTADQNKIKEIIDINFKEGFNVLEIQRKMEISGHFKAKELNKRLFFGNFLEEEFTRYGTRHFYHCNRRMDNDDEEVKKKMNALTASFKKKHIEGLEGFANENYDVEVENYSHQIVDAARYSKNPFVFQDNFAITKKFIKRAGPNYLFEIGKFIDSQVHIEKEEEKRSLNVDIEHTKTYEYQVQVKIPDGYEVTGLENLQKNVSNDTGSFTVTAKVENGFLSYTSIKTYAKSHYSAAEWSKMLPWLKAAYDFSQEKVMFKKI